MEIDGSEIQKRNSETRRYTIVDPGLSPFVPVDIRSLLGLGYFTSFRA
jgi:hypothetical protein